MKAEDRIKELYGFDLSELPDESAVDSAGHIGMTDFGKKRIVIPGFGRVLSNVFSKYNSKFREYSAIAKGLKDYILGHEVNVEVAGRPRGEAEHSMKERNYLEYLREEGYTLPYLIGLTLHRMRLNRGDRTGFSKNISSYIGNWSARYDRFVDGLEEPLGVLLGLRKIPREYAFEKVR